MYASQVFLQILVSGALIITIIAPVLFLVLLFRDWKGRKLW
jgi:hypothetical protein